LLFVRTTLFLGCALALMAQSDQDTQPTQDAQAPDAQSAPEYGGPAILSRGETPAMMQSPAPIAFRPYIGLSAIFDNGIVPATVTSTGQIPTPDVYGVELNLGAYTYRTWKHTSLGVNYSGNFRHYSQQTFYDGTDQLLALILTHAPSKRVTFTLRNSAGTYSENYGLPTPLGIADPNYLQLPQNDIFYGPVIFLSTAADVTFHKSGRLSFNIGGEGDLVRRRSTALYGSTEGSARADMEYRLTRHSTLGVDYRFTYYSYTKGFGNTDINSVGLNYSTQFTRHLQLSARIGGARVQSLSLAEVPIDPVVAALLGETVGIQVAHQLSYVPDIMARLTDTFRRSTLGVSYINGVSPGNGVYLSSRSQSETVSYSYTGVRHWNFGASAAYSRMDALVQTLGAYTSYGGGIGVTRDLGKGLHTVLRLDTRHYDIPNNQFLHTEYRATLGLTFSPGDVPLVLW
jgi:hypothetical protein